jgi:hypothetical protein
LYPLLQDLTSDKFVGENVVLYNPQWVRAKGRSRAYILSYLDKSDQRNFNGQTYYFCQNCLTVENPGNQYVYFQSQVLVLSKSGLTV